MGKREHSPCRTPASHSSLVTYSCQKVVPENAYLYIVMPIQSPP